MREQHFPGIGGTDEQLATRGCPAIGRYRSLDPLADTYLPSLTDTQYIIAREYGYTSWRKLEERQRAAGRESSTMTSAVLCRVAAKSDA